MGLASLGTVLKSKIAWTHVLRLCEGDLHYLAWLLLLPPLHVLFLELYLLSNLALLDLLEGPYEAIIRSLHSHDGLYLFLDLLLESY